jgi:WD40 repeat protein
LLSLENVQEAFVTLRLLGISWGSCHDILRAAYQTAALVASFTQLHPPLPPQGRGYHLAVSAKTGRVAILDADTLQPLVQLRDAKEGVTEMKYSPPGGPQTLAAASNDLKIYLYRVSRNYQLIGRCGLGPVQSCGRLTSRRGSKHAVLDASDRAHTHGAQSCTRVIPDACMLRCVLTPPLSPRCVGHSGSVLHLDWTLPVASPLQLRGSMLLASSDTSREILFWNPSTAKKVNSNQRDAQRWPPRLSRPTTPPPFHHLSTTTYSTTFRCIYVTVKHANSNPPADQATTQSPIH